MNPSVERLANPAANDTLQLYQCGPRVPCIELANHPSLLFGSKHPLRFLLQFMFPNANAKRLFFVTISNFVPTK